MNALHISAGRISGSAMVKRRDAATKGLLPLCGGHSLASFGGNDGTRVRRYSFPLFILPKVHQAVHTARAKRARRVRAPSSYVEFKHRSKSSVMQVVCSSCRALSSDGDEAGRCDKQAAGPLRAVRQGGRGSRRRHHRGTASAWRPPRSSPPPPTPAPPPPPPPARRTRRPRRSCTGWSSPR